MAKTVDRLSMWDWTTLVAAWRYYEHGHTIASAQFPGDIVRRYWGNGNKYTDNVRMQIANQFANVDHGIRGEGDWPADAPFFDIDGRTWRKFYCFCKTYCDGFATVMAEGPTRKAKIKAFCCGGKWYPVDEYINSPSIECYILKDYIKEIKNETQY